MAKSRYNPSTTTRRSRAQGALPHAPSSTLGFPARATRPAGQSDSLAERIYWALKHDIITGAHPPGEVLGEKPLARQYRGSRTPVREAAVRLQQEGLLRIVPNRGYFVSQITVRGLNELYEYRAAVEAGAAELAARKAADPTLLEELTQLARTEYRVDDRKSYLCFIEADTALHVGIARLTRNAIFLRSVTELRCQMERIMYAAIDIGYYGEYPVQEHCDILDAIRRRDPQAARKLMFEHISGSRDKVLRLAGQLMD